MDEKIKIIDYETKHVYELCNVEKYRYYMYLVCSQCHNVFACFGCGSAELNKRNYGIKSKVYNMVSCVANI